jgi:hypothetical protein
MTHPADHAHAWVPTKSASGLTHLRECTCGGRHIKGSPNYVRADGTLWRLARTEIETED